jgi:hypothetical protein
MKIRELFEAGIIAPQSAGGTSGDNPTEAPPNTSNTPQTDQPTGSAPANTTPPPAQQMGQQTSQPTGSAPAQANPQQQQQQQQLAQQSKDTMTDLDKIAAQIIALKQRQQQMQQQMQTPPAE